MPGILLVFFVTVAFINKAAAQNFSTKGVEFWAGYAPHVNMYNKDGSIRSDGGTQKMVFYFLSNKLTHVKVEIPSLNWEKKYTVKANAATESDEMPKTDAGDSRLVAEGVSAKGIHITSDEKITVYCHIYDAKISATALLIPLNIAGQEYYTVNYSQRADNDKARSYCFVIATENNTTVEVVPAANTLQHAAGVPFTQKLNKGEILQLLGKTSVREGHSYVGTDLTGTYIRTVNSPGDDSCKKIVVFSGSSSVNILCNDDINNSSDNLIQQMPSLEGWGNYFITVPTAKMPVNKFRALVLYPNQRVSVNGQRLTNLQRGRFYEFQADKPAIVSSDSLILLTQYITSAAKCGNIVTDSKTGDPEMFYLTPLGNSINTIITNGPVHSDITEHFVNVLVQASDIDSFRLDGKTMPEAFTIVARNPEYATAQIPVLPGRHLLQADSTLHVYAYGYGEQESYGYNAGFAVNHTNGQIGLINEFADNHLLTTCAATPFRLYFDVETKLSDIEWKFNNNRHLQPNQDVRIENIQPDSTYRKGGSLFYRYYLPGTYEYNTTGQLPVDVLASLPGINGCIAKKLFDQQIQVIPKPLAKWSLLYDQCANKLLSFTDNSVTDSSTGTKEWLWDFGDGTTSKEKNPFQQYNGYGEYKIVMKIIDKIGCSDDTAATVGLYHKPVAAFDISGSLCSKEDISFKSTATAEEDGLLELTWNFADGTTSTLQNPVKQFTGGADYEVKLIAKNIRGCTDTVSRMVRIYEKPEIKLPPVLYVFAGDTLRLRPIYRGNIKSYTWSPPLNLTGSTTPYPLATAANDISYSVTVFAEGSCKAVAATAIKLQRKPDIPNAFSPNGDGFNDTWRIKNIRDYAGCTVEIFNRWGARLFYSRGYGTDWDGRFNGQPLPAGTYYYVINTNSTLQNNVLSGSITVLK